MEQSWSYPARGMGIEICTKELITNVATGHTPRGVWGLKSISIFPIFDLDMSYPARGMGIEIALISIFYLLSIVIPREGYGD